MEEVRIHDLIVLMINLMAARHLTGFLCYASTRAIYDVDNVPVHNIWPVMLFGCFSRCIYVFIQLINLTVVLASDENWLRS